MKTAKHSRRLSKLIEASPTETLARLIREGQLDDGASKRALDAIRKRNGSQEPLLLNRMQAARLVGVSSHTLWRWSLDGIIPSIIIGASRWFRSEDLKAAVARIAPATPPSKAA